MLELLWIQIETSKHNRLFIGVYYGPQENRTAREEAIENYSEIQKDIQQIKNENGEVILTGDFNVKAIETETHSISRDGKVLLQLPEEENLVLMNTSAKCKGKWTRVNPNNPKEKSTIDYNYHHHKRNSQLDIAIDIVPDEPKA